MTQTITIEHPEHGREEVLVDIDGKWHQNWKAREISFYDFDGWREVKPDAVDVTEQCKVETQQRIFLPWCNFIFTLPDDCKWHKPQAVVLPEDWRTFSFNQLQVLLLNGQQSVLLIKREGGG